MQMVMVAVTMCWVEIRRRRWWRYLWQVLMNCMPDVRISDKLLSCVGEPANCVTPASWSSWRAQRRQTTAWNPDSSHRRTHLSNELRNYGFRL